MHWNLVSNMPLSQSLWFSLDSLLPHSFPPKQNSGEGGVWSPLGASAEPLPHPTLASAHQDAIISGAMSITWSRKAPFTYVYISYNKFTPLLILLFTMNMAKVTIGLCPLSRAPPLVEGPPLCYEAPDKSKRYATSSHQPAQCNSPQTMANAAHPMHYFQVANFCCCCSFYTGTLIDNPKS